MKSSCDKVWYGRFVFKSSYLRFGMVGPWSSPRTSCVTRTPRTSSSASTGTRSSSGSKRSGTYWNIQHYQISWARWLVYRPWWKLIMTVIYWKLKRYRPPSKKEWPKKKYNELIESFPEILTFQLWENKAIHNYLTVLTSGLSGVRLEDKYNQLKENLELLSNIASK